MNKLLYFLIMTLFFTSTLYSQEPILAKLNAVYSNAYLKFGIEKYEFLCKPYGVVSIDELYQQSKVDSICRNSIDRYYKKNPLDKYYTFMLLKNRQYYHVDFKNTRCILYAKGKITLSELLLKEGLAIKKRAFSDLEFNYYFTEAQLVAKENKRGIYKGDIYSNCLIELDELDKKEE